MQKLPEGKGLAAQFPGDKGIARHAAVILTEDFESGDIASLKMKWSDISNKAGKPLALESKEGRRALKITATLGENNGGHLFTLLPRATETLFARFYVRFEPDADYPEICSSPCGEEAHWCQTSLRRQAIFCAKTCRKTKARVCTKVGVCCIQRVRSAACDQATCRQASFPPCCSKCSKTVC
jgi:hypothetical protein